MQPGNNGNRRLRLAGTRRTRAAAFGVAGAAAAAAIVGMALPAGATPVTAQHGGHWGTEHFQMMNTTTSQTSTTNPVVAYGVLTAGGTDIENANGTDTFVFPGGTFTVTHTPAPGSPQQPTINTQTCMFQITQTGTFKLSGGTGKYWHISGGGSYRLSVIGIGSKLANGACNQSETAPLVAQQQLIQAVGKIRL